MIRSVVLPRISVHRKLVGIAWIGAAITCVVGILAFRALDQIRDAADRASAADAVVVLARHESAAVEGIRALTYFSLGSTFDPSLDGVELTRTMDAATSGLRDTQRDLENSLRAISSSESAIELPGDAPFMQQARLFAQARADGLAVKREDVLAFDALAARISAQIRVNEAMLSQRATKARVNATAIQKRARTTLFGVIGVAVILLVGLCNILARSILRRLKEMRTIAERLTGGDLDARISVRGNDELAVLAAAFNETADSVKSLLAVAEADAARDAFTRELSSAFEMADSEPLVHDVVERGMYDLDRRMPMELLLSDSSRAHLEQAVVNPDAPAPHCPVEEPYACVAVRRGQAAVFESSSALNSCPKLRNRAEGEISACCIPVSFMGRSLGVLHATGPVGTDWSADSLDRLRTLAAQTGTRIGTVRSVERTQLQAATDSLTGLLNRRSVEVAVRRLLKTHKQFALVIADLDGFKKINDTHGHDAGDRALKLFAGVVRANVRESDLIGRLGGEEFAFLLPETPTENVPLVVDQLRDKLAAALVGNPPAFTASFGVASSEHGETFEEIFRVADAALYRAKEEGRDRVALANAQDEARAEQASSTDSPARGTDFATREDGFGAMNVSASTNGHAGHNLASEDDPMD